MTNEFDDIYEARLAAIDARVSGKYPDLVASYSASSFDDDELPVDNLDEVAVHGTVVFVAKHDAFWGEGADYRSDPIQDPTWWDVLLLADKMIAQTGDDHHIFLEGIQEGEQVNGVRICTFEMGS